MSGYVRLERDLDNLCLRFYSNPFGPMFNKLSKSKSDASQEKGQSFLFVLERYREGSSVKLN